MIKLKDILSEEWDTSVIADYSNSEIEKSCDFTTPSPITIFFVIR